MKAPSENQLKKVERELRRQLRGAQRAVGGGIYMRLDSAGQRRFMFLRDRSSGAPGGTYDSWQEAVDERARLQAATPAAPKSTAEAARATAAEIRNWPIADYVDHTWWPKHVVRHLDVTTQDDYDRGWQALKPHVQGITLGDLLDSPLLIDEIKDKIEAAKTFPPGHKRAGQLPTAGADKPLHILSRICSHAVDRQILPRNPMAGVRYFSHQRGSKEDKAGSNHRPILQIEVQLPHTAALAGSGMLAGDPLTLARRRLIPKLIVAGMRPSDILATRNECWRDEHGPLPLMHISSAVKDVRGHLIEGEPKTGARVLYLFASIAEELETIYQLAERPDLDKLTFPNLKGTLLDWGNFRDDVWYPALHRAGISNNPSSDAKGAFYPYLLRHVGVTLMLHAERPEGGRYSERQVARQFGHSVATLDRVYADIPDDMHGIAGLTMDEILRQADREVWGPKPGDLDYQEKEYDLLQAAELTGKTRNALAAQIQRGSLPGTKRKNRWYVTHFDLAWHCLVPPWVAENHPNR